MSILESYENFMKRKGIRFFRVESVEPYNNSTLFCPAGIQRFGDSVMNMDVSMTTSNCQACIRMNDFEELGDLTHLLYFNMLGLFSFRMMSVKETIDLWMEFLGEVDVLPDTVTIHPNKTEWAAYYKEFNVNVELSEDCYWGLGEVSGFSTEFFREGVEIGNIVNPNGDCIDVGFGLERIELFKGIPALSRVEKLKQAAEVIINSGYKPSNLRQGYVLRKILREIYKSGEVMNDTHLEIMNHPYFKQEVERQQKIHERYNRLKDKFPDKDKGWWYDTHGINLDEL